MFQVSSQIRARLQLRSVSSEISDFTPYAHEQSDILHIKYVEKSDDWGLGFDV